MVRRIASLALENLSDLPAACRRCVFWELDPVAGSRAETAGDTAFEKEAWLSSTLLEWGSCGKLIYVDDVLFGQLIVNLVENALKYTPEGTPIEIAADASNDAVILEIRDRGPGFDLAAVPDPLVPLITACLAKDPAARAGLDDIIARCTALGPRPRRPRH